MSGTEFNLFRYEKSVRQSTLLGIYMLLVMVFIVIGTLSRDFLPQVYSYDGIQIQAIAQDRPYVVADYSFIAAGNVYKFLGLAYLPIVVAILGPTIMGWALWSVLKQDLLEGKLVGWMLSVLGMAWASIYLSWYSKDLITLVFVMIFVKLRHLVPSISLLPLLIYATFFKQYWFLIIGLYFVFILFRKFISKGTIRILPLIALAFLALEFTSSSFAGTSLSTIRENLNFFRLGSEDATTMITNFIDGKDLISVTANLFLTFISLLAPWPLLLLGKPIYMISSVAIVFVWWSFWTRGLMGVRTTDKSDKRESFVRFLLSFLIVLAICEPDYGSYIRHLTPALPVIGATIVLAGRRGKELHEDKVKLGVEK